MKREFRLMNGSYIKCVPSKDKYGRYGVTMKCPHCSQDIEGISKVTTIEIDGWLYETKTHDFDKELKDIQIPKGWRLWKALDFEKFSLKDWDTLNLKDTWFFIKYPFAYNPNNYVAWFGANSDRAYLSCYGSPSYADSSLGVRFCRKKHSGEFWK